MNDAMTFQFLKKIHYSMLNMHFFIQTNLIQNVA